MANYVVKNEGNNPMAAYNFMLRVEALFDLPCKKITGLQKEHEYEYIQEGGLNDYVHMRRKPISKPFTFQVERYVGVDYFDPLPNGAELILPLLLFVSRNANGFLTASRTYIFAGCTVTGKNYGDLNSEQSGLLTETTTIAYCELVVADQPLEELLTKEWKFDQNKLEGNKMRSASVNTNEIRKKDMNQRDEYRKWSFQGNRTEQGSGKR